MTTVRTQSMTFPTRCARDGSTPPRPRAVSCGMGGRGSVRAGVAGDLWLGRTDCLSIRKNTQSRGQFISRKVEIWHCEASSKSDNSDQVSKPTILRQSAEPRPPLGGSRTAPTMLARVCGVRFVMKDGVLYAQYRGRPREIFRVRVDATAGRGSPAWVEVRGRRFAG